MIIVGVGVGPGMLTEESIEAIGNATEVYGSPRALELAQSHIKGEGKVITDYKNLHLLPEDAVILSTGDPMFSGLGRFATGKDRIIPGISSLQVACARLGLDMAGIAIITAHGRDPGPAKEAFVREIRLGKNIFLLPADTFGSEEVAGALQREVIEASIYVCENFGYPEEKIIRGDVFHPPIAESPLYCIVVVI
jgi:cobalt-precorrin-7 (C5)-methyltransferase